MVRALKFLSMSFASLVCILNVPWTVIAQPSYQLDTSYSGENFFEDWIFFSTADPTHGYVDFQTESEALDGGYINASIGSAYIGVDNVNTVMASARGRKSVRIETKKTWQLGLFIGDIAHMPGSACGVWPAFWMVGAESTWPADGEIDIIEGVHANSKNLVSLHTAPDCVMEKGNMSGLVNCLNCDGTLNGNVACNANAQHKDSYGAGFNENEGGVYAMEWTAESIKVWFFPRSHIPEDISAEAPDPNTWGLPQVDYQGGSGCGIDKHFNNQRLVFDTTFCGDWAGGTWGTTTCSRTAPTCEGYVASNPSAFKEAYWSINSVKAYQLGNAAADTEPAPTTSITKPGVASSIKPYLIPAVDTAPATPWLYAEVSWSSSSSTIPASKTSSLPSSTFPVNPASRSLNNLSSLHRWQHPSNTTYLSYNSTFNSSLTRNRTSTSRPFNLYKSLHTTTTQTVTMTRMRPATSSSSFSSSSFSKAHYKKHAHTR